jgi:hypothetical protein
VPELAQKQPILLETSIQIVRMALGGQPQQSSLMVQ